MNALSERIYQMALSCGFDNCGIISIDALDGFQSRLEERQKKVPTSKMFYKLVDGLGETKERFPWAKSVVVCSFSYGKYRYPKELRGRYAKDFFLKPENQPGTGYDRPRLEAWMNESGIRFAGGEQFEYFSVAPLRYAAVMAGMGIIRKNNFFYTEKGSYNLLLGYVIDQDCALIHQTDLKPCSDACDLCQKACKTKSLSAPYTFSPLKCVSFWTTFGKGAVPPFLKADMFEEWVCGCDNCQDACPYNQKKNWDEGEPFSDLEEIAAELSPENVITKSDEYLIENIISRTDNHLKEADVLTLRKSAKRAIRYRQKQH